MKSFRKELWFEIPSRRGFVNITPQVQECLRASGIAVCEETARPGSDGIFVRHNRNLVDAHTIYLEKERRDLTAAVKFYCGGDLTDAHSAIADVRAPRRVVEAQIRRYSDLPNSADGLGNFCREARPNKFADSGYWFAWKSGMLIFAKSKKHKGEPLLEVAKCDPGFLQWMLTKGFPDDGSTRCPWQAGE